MFTTNNKKFAVILFVLVGVALLSNCVSNEKEHEPDLRGQLYAGSQTCRNCHKDLYDDFVHTAHFNSTGKDLPSEVKAAFTSGKNIFRFNDSTTVVMEKQGNQYFQSYYRNGKKLQSRPFDIVVGSGRKAQTYLYYNDKKKISQLPISYFMSVHAWANSPGFPAEDAKFDRNVPSYCLGCHSSYISVNQTYQGVAMQEEFEKGKIVYGIDCERCHGPGLTHAEYFTNRAGSQGRKFMTSIKTLNRVQQNDMCALCHSGFREVQQSLFKFKPGDNLYSFYAPEFGRTDTTKMDVHGNQTQLMMASKCFTGSNSLTCNTCHNVHVKERDNMEVFNQRCMNCHNEVAHNFEVKDIKSLTSNCVNCHMPLKASSITMLTNQYNKAVADSIRTHLVAIYPKESKAVLKNLLKR